jgi:uncharacterized membrane protein YhaH (DUF805 family)
MTEYINVLAHHYVDFKGRSRRREFWFFSVFHGLVYVVTLGILFAEGGFTDQPSTKQVISAGVTSLLLFLYSVFTLLPTVALTVRRLHDIGRSGWSVLYLLVPNSLLWYVLNMTFDSQPGPNRWGPNSKGLPASTEAI